MLLNAAYKVHTVDGRHALDKKAMAGRTAAERVRDQRGRRSGQLNTMDVDRYLQPATAERERITSRSKKKRDEFVSRSMQPGMSRRNTRRS